MYSNHMTFRSRFFLLLAVALPGISVRADEATPDRFAKWESEIAAFEAKDAAHPPENGGIVFVGSSSIRMWKTLESDFPRHRVLNRGFGGSEIEDSVHFADRIVIPYAPRMIVMYAGGNDINSGKTPERVAADFRAFVEKVGSKLPNVEIKYISIAGNPKRWEQVEKVKKANALIKDICTTGQNTKFIDVFTPMLGADALPKPDIFLEDKLHMNAAGYEIWTRLIGPELGAPDR